MSERKPKAGSVRVTVVKGSEPVVKADAPLQMNEQEAVSAGEWIEPEQSLKGLSVMVDQSTILPQCIRAT